MSTWPDDEDENLDEDPDASDQDDSDDSDTRTCPYCGKEVYEQAEVCPHCRSYLSIEQAPRGRPVWIMITGAVLLAAMLYAAAKLLWL